MDQTPRKLTPYEQSFNLKVCDRRHAMGSSIPKTRDYLAEAVPGHFDDGVPPIGSGYRIAFWLVMVTIFLAAWKIFDIVSWIIGSTF